MLLQDKIYIKRGILMENITQDTLKKHRIELNKWTAERKQRQDKKENDKKIIDMLLIYFETEEAKKMSFNELESIRKFAVWLKQNW